MAGSDALGRGTILLAGSGRSGTTWLSELIAAHPNVRVIFEPFDPRRVEDPAALGLHTYLRPGTPLPEQEDFVRRVLEGRVENEWTRQLGRRWWARRRLVKTIRANLLLGWLDAIFDVAVVYCIRHPCAVALSRAQLGWEAHLDRLLAQPDLVTDHLEPYLDVIGAARTDLERHAVAWCIENLVPLRQMAAYDWTLCSYEKMCREPNGEIARVYGRLGLGCSWLARRRNVVAHTARPESAVVQGRDPVVEWRRRLSAAEIDAVCAIVRAFDIDLYDESEMPHLPTPS
jgi:hypothetical protein